MKIPGPGTYSDMRDKLHYKTITGSKIGKDMRKSTFLKTNGFTNPSPGSHNCTFWDK